MRQALDRLPGTTRARTPAPPARAALVPTRPPSPPPGNLVPTAAARPHPPRPAPPAAIQATRLTKTYAGSAAVSDLSFSVPRGKVTAFIGPNGSGKTTTIRMLLGLVRPTSGDATVLGSSIRRPHRYLRRVGALVESPAFEPQLSGRRNLQVLGCLTDTPDARIEAALRLVGLAGVGRKPYRSYSLGMRQRLGLAAALLDDPELLILDEPTNGLDVSGIQEMRNLLRGLADAGKTVFVSSHLASEVERFCDHVVVLREGRLVHAGPLASLTAGGRRLEDAIVELTGRGSL